MSVPAPKSISDEGEEVHAVFDHMFPDRDAGYLARWVFGREVPRSNFAQGYLVFVWDLI